MTIGYWRPKVSGSDPDLWSVISMMKTLFLQAPSFDGFDGGAGARYQMSREVRSFWYPTWLAQPAALVDGSKLIDAPRPRGDAHLDAIILLRRADRRGAQGAQAQPEDRTDRRQGCSRAREEPA